MNLLEFVFAIALCGVFYAISTPFSNQSLSMAKNVLSFHLKSAQILALSDDREFLHLQDTSATKVEFPSIDTTSLLTQTQNALWQVQFHIGKIYSTFSYSLFVDTPRFAKTTDFDSRPMAGDIIALDSLRRCISGYNNTNTSVECRNNTLFETRLSERLGIENLEIFAPVKCSERDTARVHFDRFARPMCAKIPTRFQSSFQIHLSKKSQTTALCILPQGKITGC